MSLNLLAGQTEYLSEPWPDSPRAERVRRAGGSLRLLALRSLVNDWRAAQSVEAAEALAASMARLTRYAGVGQLAGDAEFVAWLARAHDAAGEEGPARAAADFERFLLMPSLATGAELDTRVPLDAAGDLRLPGFPGRLVLGASLAGQPVRMRLAAGAPVDLSDRAAVARALTSDARLSLERADDGKPLAPQLREYPLIDGIAVLDETALLRDALALVKGMPARVLPLEESRAWEDVAAALAELDRLAPHLADGVRTLVRWVVPIATDWYHSSTDASLPGAIFVTLGPGNPAWNAELLVHEAAHNWWYQLRQLDPLLAATPARYGSPWRPDRRPVSGVAAGVHAFLMVTEYLVAKWRSRDEPTAAIATRAVGEHERVQRGLRSLDQHATWTAAGEVFVAGLSLRSERVGQEIRRLKAEFPAEWRSAAAPLHLELSLGDRGQAEGADARIAS